MLATNAPIETLKAVKDSLVIERAEQLLIAIRHKIRFSWE